MIAGLSKAVILYLAPLLTITALLLSIFAFLSPVVMLQDRVALLTVTPLVQTGSSQSVDGPSVFLGVLGILFLQNCWCQLMCPLQAPAPVSTMLLISIAQAPQFRRPTVSATSYCRSYVGC